MGLAMKNTRVMTHSVRAEFEAVVNARTEILVAQGFYCRDENDRRLRPLQASCLLWIESNGKDVVRQGDYFLLEDQRISLTEETRAMLIAYCDLFRTKSSRIDQWLSYPKSIMDFAIRSLAVLRCAL
jgi:hypothetical protein